VIAEVPGAPAAPPQRAAAAPLRQAPTAGASPDAAAQFEGLILQQLLKVLRQSAPSMASGPGGETYMQMFDSAISEQLAQQGGIGLADVLRQSIDGQGGGGGAGGSFTPGMPMPLSPLSIPAGADAFDGPPVGAPAAGATARVQRAAVSLLSGGAERWSRGGTLSAADLRASAAQARVHEPGGGARLAVQSAQGYHGYTKCNLFAFELAGRAGFDVPLVERPGGLGLPASNRVTADAADGELQGGWGEVLTGRSADELGAELASGRRALMLSGSGREGRSGHMAVVERIHHIDYDARGRAERVVFDGWEARTGGAQYLERRSWTRYGNATAAEPGASRRAGFEAIEIIGLNKKMTMPARVSGQVPGTKPPATVDHDSSSITDRSKAGSEVIP